MNRHRTKSEAVQEGCMDTTQSEQPTEIIRVIAEETPFDAATVWDVYHSNAEIRERIDRIRDRGVGAVETAPLITDIAVSAFGDTP